MGSGCSDGTENPGPDYRSNAQSCQITDSQILFQLRPFPGATRILNDLGNGLFSEKLIKHAIHKSKFHQPAGYLFGDRNKISQHP